MKPVGEHIQMEMCPKCKRVFNAGDVGIQSQNIISRGSLIEVSATTCPCCKYYGELSEYGCDNEDFKPKSQCYKCGNIFDGIEERGFFAPPDSERVKESEYHGSFGYYSIDYAHVKSCPKCGASGVVFRTVKEGREK